MLLEVGWVFWQEIRQFSDQGECLTLVNLQAGFSKVAWELPNQFGTFSFSFMGIQAGVIFDAKGHRHLVDQLTNLEENFVWFRAIPPLLPPLLISIFHFSNNFDHLSSVCWIRYPTLRMLQVNRISYVSCLDITDHTSVEYELNRSKFFIFFIL